MAAYTSPKRSFDSHLASDMVDPSKLGFSGFDDFFHIDPQSFLNDNSSAQPSPVIFAYNAPMGMGQSAPVSSGGPTMNTQPSPGAFSLPQQPEIWIDQNMWLDPSAGQKDGLIDLDVKYDPTGPHVDYNFLAGENVGLFGVDPTLMQHQQHQHSQHHPSVNTPPYPIGPPLHVGQCTHPISPATSHNSSQAWKKSQSDSPLYGQSLGWPRHHSHSSSRRPSIHSVNSRISHGSPRHGSVEIDEEGKERTQCPYPDCGKAFKDLKAHMLTHQNERPEKCPITSCEFHKRGFARKYDRNRHLVTTHYKATIVCGFCPGSGSSSEKSFNRTDVFKRHLVSVHGVEQTPTNSKRKTPHSSARQSPSLPDDATGKCSTCGNVFASPQELFEHFDECVLRVVTQTDPGEEANEKNLLSVVEDGDVKATMERHSLQNDAGSSDDADYISDGGEEMFLTPRAARSGKGALSTSKGNGSGGLLHSVAEGHVTKNTNRPNPAGKGSAGLTYSKGGVTLAVGKGRKKRKHYPQSWGCSMDKMKLKKRVLCVFDGQRRLWKDDMMLGDDFEVRMQLPNADDGSYVTDLDVETLKRAEAFHAASEEERGPWIPSNYSGDWSLAQQQLTA